MKRHEDLGTPPVPPFSLVKLIQSISINLDGLLFRRPPPMTWQHNRLCVSTYLVLTQLWVLLNSMQV
jgi:hypothetical protein